MPEAGETLAGRYRLVSLLGRGGMADVYRAWDDERSAEVAVKVLREDYAEEPEFIRRFSREAQALATLDHPNIVRFYSFEQDGCTAFIVMDCVRGSTLRGRLRDAGGPLPLDETTRILHEIGAALGFAHRRGYLHRDIKPANIMIDERGRALLSDFGIAKAAEATTATHSGAGTPAYMSPEQILGRPLDARSDVYSLGVVLYEMVAGRRPFVGDVGTGTTAPNRVLDEHLHASPPDPRQFWRVPAGTASVILHALAKDPEERWPDMGSMVAAWDREAAGDGAPASVATVPMRPAVASGRQHVAMQEPAQSEAPALRQPGPAIAEPQGGGSVPNKGRHARLWEIDALRGVAILMMVVYHLMYDLAYLGFTYVAFTPPYDVAFDIFQVATASLFLGLVGVSLALSAGRYTRQTRRPYPLGHLVKRGARILCWGLIVSLVTRVAVGPIYVRFGILHFIGLSIIAAYPFLRRPRLCLPAAVLALGLGLWLRTLEVGHPWLLWLGLNRADQLYVDYFPLLPWFSVVLTGIVLGHRFYPEGLRAFRLPDLGTRWYWRCLAVMGRHSLLIYLTHQPVLVLVLTLIRPQAVLGLIS